MTEFRVITMSGPMRIAAASQAEANQIAIQDGHTLFDPTAKKKFCGNRNCSTSTGICGSTTHGYGLTDDNGYFENPCFLCARFYEKLEEVKVGTHWPFPKLDKLAVPAIVTKTMPAIERLLPTKHQFEVEEIIKKVLMDQGTLWLDDLHQATRVACSHQLPNVEGFDGLFDKSFCALVGYGKLQLIFPGPKVSVTPRNRMPACN